MKKTLSILLVLTMVVAMFVPMTVSTSAAFENELLTTYEAAKDGDKLIDLLFGQTTGAYQPIVFANSADETLHEGVRYHCTPVITVSDDGKSVKMFYDDQGEEGDNYGNLLYGGKIDGLKWGYDESGNPYQYTFTLKALFDDEESDNRQSGFYFSMGENLVTSTDEDGRTIINIDGSTTGHLGAYGWWGHTCNSVFKNPMRWHRIEKDGMTNQKLDDITSADFKIGLMEGVSQWYNICVEIDGYKMQIRFNGWKLGLGEGQEDVFYDHTEWVEKDGATSHDLAFIGRLYNETMNFDIKDVTVYKGIGLDLPGYTDAPSTLPEEEETTAAPEDDATDAPADDETNAPADDATQAPADDATNAPADDATTAGNNAGNTTDGGCASVATASIALIAILGTAIVFKKRH